MKILLLCAFLLYPAIFLARTRAAGLIMLFAADAAVCAAFALSGLEPASLLVFGLISACINIAYIFLPFSAPRTGRGMLPYVVAAVICAGLSVMFALAVRAAKTTAEAPVLFSGLPQAQVVIALFAVFAAAGYFSMQGGGRDE